MKIYACLEAHVVGSFFATMDIKRSSPIKKFLFENTTPKASNDLNFIENFIKWTIIWDKTFYEILLNTRGQEFTETSNLLNMGSVDRSPPVAKFQAKFYLKFFERCFDRFFDRIFDKNKGILHFLNLSKSKPPPYCTRWTDLVTL